MDFKQVEDTFDRKTWLSECGHYRITYRNLLPDCKRYKPPYYAEVLSEINGRKIWSFAHKRGPFWSFAAAAKACKSNRYQWKRLLKAKSAEEARALIAASRVGLTKRGRSTHQTVKILSYPPKWVEDRMPRRLRRLLPGAGPPRVRQKVKT